MTSTETVRALKGSTYRINADLRLGQRRRRSVNFNPALGPTTNSRISPFSTHRCHSSQSPLSLRSQRSLTILPPGVPVVDKMEQPCINQDG